MKKEGKRKALAGLVCGSMLTVALVGGTMAYLADTAGAVNVMTLGNVDIEQIEQQRKVDAETGEFVCDSAENFVLEPFGQGKGLYPDTEIDKIVTAKNTGKSDAYFRTLIAFEDIDSETFALGIVVDEPDPKENYAYATNLGWIIRSHRG